MNTKVAVLLKHPVTTTLTNEELAKLHEARGSSSMLKFVHDAILEKCEGCRNERDQLGKIEPINRPEIESVKVGDKQVFRVVPKKPDNPTSENFWLFE